MKLLFLCLATAAALRAPIQQSNNRRSVLAGAAAALSLPLQKALAFDLPLLEEFDDPAARRAYARMPNPELKKQQSSAFYAVSTGDMDTLQKMVDAGWELNKVKDTAGKGVLHRAAQVGNEPAVQVLLKAGCE